MKTGVVLMTLWLAGCASKAPEPEAKPVEIPRGTISGKVSFTGRPPAAKRIDIAFTIDQGPRTYVERIDIHGNTRTRAYVIRRKFDISEGDAYNRALVDRAERRLKNLDFFKSVKILTEPGTGPPRVLEGDAATSGAVAAGTVRRRAGLGPARSQRPR